ncbi:porin [Vibrio sinensis]|nr:porin [Vibrio sinensis]
MKKTLVALAVLAAGTASAVNAAEIYNADGSVLELTGRAFAIIEHKKTDTDSDTDVLVDDSRLGFKVRHQVTDAVAAVGKFEFQLTTQDDGSALKNRDVYAGLDFTDTVAVTFGRQTTSFDDYAFRGGFDEYYGYSQELEDRGRANGIIKAESANMNGLVVSGSYQFKEEEAGKDITGATLAASYDAEFGLGLSAGYFDYKQSGNNDHATGFNVGASYAFGDAKVGADYSSEDHFDKSSADAFRLGGEYFIDAYRLYAGYGQVDEKPVVGDSVDKDGFYAGVAYAFGAKTTLFVEGASYDNGTSADDDRLALGINVNF